jgi:hypothetical protein
VTKRAEAFFAGERFALHAVLIVVEAVATSRAE